MNRENFNSGFAALVAAFKNSESVTTETADVYYEVLKEIPDDLFVAGVKKCIAQQNFFPTAHEIGAAACGEQKEELIEKCNPWREHQFFKEKIPGITWQQNLQKILQALEGPDTQEIKKLASKVLKSESETSPDVRDLKRQIAELKRTCDALVQENFRLKRENDKLREKPRLTVEERKAQLKEQAEMLKKQNDQTVVVSDSGPRGNGADLDS